VAFTPLEDIDDVNYELQWRDYHGTWETNMKSSIAENPKEAVAKDLEPGSTYAVRLICVNKNDSTDKGEPCRELILDTEQVGCTPKPDKKTCCVIS